VVAGELEAEHHSGGEAGGGGERVAVDSSTGARLAGWETVRGDDSINDVCPGCLTDVERADQILRHVEAGAMFAEDV
jgi:hypothetical protein